MIVFELNHTNSKTLLHALANELQLPIPEQDFIVLSPPAGTGFIKFIELADDLQVLLADVVFNRYFIASRKPSADRHYVLHFEDVTVTDTAKFSVDGEIVQKKQTRHAVVRLTSNVFSNTEEITAHTPAKVVKVFFSEAWLKKYLGLGEDVDGLQKYVSLKTTCIDIEPLDDEYLRLMDELWNAKKEDPLQNVFLKNRVSLLIERFFARLSEKMKTFEGRRSLSEDDMQRLMRVEQLLVNNPGETPPTIEELSKLVMMSATRLKKNFKEMYGSGIYAYYQTVRLQKAKELLLSGRYNIKQTAEEMGFNNTANFSAAFKKQFNMLPADLIKQS